MKKIYQKPNIETVVVNIETALLDTSSQSVSDTTYTGGESGVLSRGDDGWDEDEEW